MARERFYHKLRSALNVSRQVRHHKRVHIEMKDDAMRRHRIDVCDVAILCHVDVDEYKGTNCVEWKIRVTATPTVTARGQNAKAKDRACENEVTAFHHHRRRHNRQVGRVPPPRHLRHHSKNEMKVGHH